MAYRLELSDFEREVRRETILPPPPPDETERPLALESAVPPPAGVPRELRDTVPPPRHGIAQGMSPDEIDAWLGPLLDTHGTQDAVAKALGCRSKTLTNVRKRAGLTSPTDQRDAAKPLPERFLLLLRDPGGTRNS